MSAAEYQVRASRRRPGTSASVGNRLTRLMRAGAALVLVGLAAACVARPVGDFERAAPSFTHDTLMPTVGKARAYLAKEPVSGFNWSDQEKLMHDRIWRFQVSQHSRDWAYDAAMELKRTRIGTVSDTKYALDRYYKWLHRTEYASSRVRYATVGADIGDDIATLPDTFAAICAVIEVDHQRQVALRASSRPSIENDMDVAARQAENGAQIAWFTRALKYRYLSYDYALDQLLVETPHEEARPVDARLNELARYVQAAERGDFCSRIGGGNGQGNGAVIPSRYGNPARDTEVVQQK